MGNAPSVPVERGGGGLPRPSLQSYDHHHHHQPSHRRNSRNSSKSNPQQEHPGNPHRGAFPAGAPGAPVRPPPKLTAQRPFQLISPASDVSNPSNFHHLKRRTRQTPVRDRRRASRVFHTQPAVTRKLHCPDDYVLEETEGGADNGRPPAAKEVLAIPHHFYIDEQEETSNVTSFINSVPAAAIRPPAAGAGAPPPASGVPVPLVPAFQRAKQAIAGCLSEALMLGPSSFHNKAGGEGRPGGATDHHHRRQYRDGAAGGGGHIQLVSTQSSSANTPSPRNANQGDEDRYLAVVAPNTSGWVRHKPIDPNIPTTVECNLPFDNDNVGEEDEEQLHWEYSRIHPGNVSRHDVSPLQFDPTASATAQQLHQPFGRILEADTEEEETSAGDGDRGRRRSIVGEGGGHPVCDQSPVCLLFADEAGHEPNFSALETSRQMIPNPNHQCSGGGGATDVVDESAYLLDHPSALDDPSNLLQVSCLLAHQNQQNSGLEGRSFSATVVANNKNLSTSSQQHHDQWLQIVLQIQQDSRRILLEAIHSRRQHRTAASVASNTTGPSRDESAAFASRGAEQQDDRMMRRAVAESVQRQINAQLRTRGRSAEPRRNSDGIEARRSRSRSHHLEEKGDRSRSASAPPPSGRERGRSAETSTRENHRQEQPTVGRVLLHQSNGCHVHQIRQQFQGGPRPDLHASSRPSRNVHRIVAPSGTMGGDEVESIVQRNRKIFDKQIDGRHRATQRRRSSSMPPSPHVPQRVGRSSSRPSASSQPLARKRSISVPATRRRPTSMGEGEPSSTFPALLQLAGWERPKAVPKPVIKKPPPAEKSALNPLPGLLQLSSGWKAAIPKSTLTSLHHNTKDNNKRLSDPFPLRRVSAAAAAAPATNRQNTRHSDPLPQRRQFVSNQPVAACAVQQPPQQQRNNAITTTTSFSSSNSIAVQTSPHLLSDIMEAVPPPPPPPLHSQPEASIEDNHLTIAHMLAQTYPLGHVYSDDDDEEDADDDARHADHLLAARTTSYMQYTYVAPMPSRAVPPILQVVSTNPGVMSAIATERVSPSTAVTAEASSNAAFLFTSDENGHYPSSTAAQRKTAPPTFGISTYDSLHRVSGITPVVHRHRASLASSSTMPPTPHAVESLTMPPRLEQLSSEEVSSSKGGPSSTAGDMNRHVRFTDSTQKREAFRALNKTSITVTTFPGIDPKLSDLTDTNNLATTRSFDSDHVAAAASLKGRIQEADDEDDEESTHVDTVVQESPMNYELSAVAAPGGADTPEEATMTNWAYSNHGLNRVTPFRQGSSAGMGPTANTTNSPYVRFKEARSKFTGNKEPPMKRSSPSAKRKLYNGTNASVEGSRASAGLVHQRVAAMEAAQNQAQQSNSPARAALRAIPQRVRRATTGHESIAPRHSTRVSPLFKPPVLPQTTMASTTQAPQPPMDANPSNNRASIHSRNSIGSQQIYRVRDSSSTVESEFGEIKHAAAFDEDSSNEERDDGVEVSGDATNQGLSPPSQSVTTSVVSDDDDEVDAFAALLHHDDQVDSEEEEEEDEEAEDETVSTIQQDKTGCMYGVSKYTNFRLSSGDSTAASGSTVSTMKQHRLSFVSSEASTNAYSRGSLGLQFRDESLVRPNEQRLPAGAKGRVRLHLSPMQRTPMQARKWRALAAEAQANDRAQRAAKSQKTKNSLSERHPNMGANHPWR